MGGGGAARRRGADGPGDAAFGRRHVAARRAAFGCCREAADKQEIGGPDMAKILGNFHLALLIGVVLLVAAMFGLHRASMDAIYWAQFGRYLHVFAGVLWIGLLYYFNFVQI